MPATNRKHIYQMHEYHGRHIAYTPQEQRHNEQNGWKTVTEEEFYEEIRGKQVLDELTGQYIDKFGKAPHHKMTADTIRKALSEESGD